MANHRQTMSTVRAGSGHHCGRRDQDQPHELRHPRRAAGREFAQNDRGHGHGYPRPVVKLADRLHNMRTLGFLSPAKQAPDRQETLTSMPAGGRLGIHKIKSELEDLCLYYLNRRVPEICPASPAAGMSAKSYVRVVIELISEKMKEFNIPASWWGGPSTSTASMKRCGNRTSASISFRHHGFRIIVERSRTDMRPGRDPLHVQALPGRFKGLHLTAQGNGTSPCTPRSWGLTPSGPRSRSGRATCTFSPRTALPRTGATRGDRLTEDESSVLPGCGRCWSGKGAEGPHRIHDHGQGGALPEDVYVFTPAATCGNCRAGRPRGFRLQHPHRSRPPLHRGQGQRLHRSAQIPFEERRHR